MAERLTRHMLTWTDRELAYRLRQRSQRRFFFVIVLCQASLLLFNIGRLAGWWT